MVFPVVGGTQDTGYEISNSLRFNDNDSAYLSITPSSAGNRRTFTYSAWIKVSYFSATSRALLSCGSDSGSNDYIMFQSGDRLRFSFGTESDGDVMTNRLFRDPSAWYHIVFAVDTTQGTAANRVKLYINGTQASDLTATYPDQNYDTAFNNTEVQRIGARAYSATQYYDGYMSDVYLIDGAQKAASDFGETNDNGVWVPKKYAGTYGTNGFKLEFKQTGTSANSSGIGADTSGNDNHFTPTNLAALDICTDSPTNNFATLNSIFHGAGSVVLSEGNCKFVGHNGGSGKVPSTIGITSGKWYAEFKITNTHKIRVGITDDIGIGNDADGVVNDGVDFGWNDGYIYTYLNGSNNDTGAGSSSSGVDVDNPSANDILGVALDADNNTVRFYVNNTAQGSEATALQRSSTANAIHFFHVYDFSGSGDDEGVVECNFGNSAFSISSGNTDANGYGSFEYEPPSGFYALCSKNLAKYG